MDDATQSPCSAEQKNVCFTRSIAASIDSRDDGKCLERDHIAASNGQSVALSSVWRTSGTRKISSIRGRFGLRASLSSFAKSEPQ